jgi:hypothetical protein
MNMSHEIHSITSFELVAPYTLQLEFEDGVIRTINLRQFLRGELYAPLRNLDFFNQVTLDRDAGTIVLPNGADFDPATLYDWDEVGEEMIQLASTWDTE